MPDQLRPQNANIGRSWAFWTALIGFIAAAAYLLWTEHRAHVASVVPYLPYLLLLACPILHFLLHGRRSHHGHRHGRDDEPR
jgi:hypothetical protein